MNNKNLKILSISSVFPNNKEPNFGIFVFKRLEAISRICPVRVVVPIPWHKLLKSNISFKTKIYNKNFIIEYSPFLYIPKIFKFSDALFYSISILKKIKKIYRKFKFDIIDAHFAYPDGVAACIISKIFKKPLIITLRGTLHRYLNNNSISKQISWAFENAILIIAVSNSLKEMALNLVKSEDKIQIVHNGIDPSLFHYMEPLRARSFLNLPDKTKILLSIGALVQNKGFHLILDILPKLIRKYSNLEYFIIGAPFHEGDISEVIKNKIKKNNLNKNVKLLGSIKNKKLIYWYAAADVFCLYSRNEGCPNVILEALATGCPVVASDAGGIPELVSSPELGYIVPYGNLDLLCSNLEKALSKNWNRKKIASIMSKNTWDHVAEKVVSLITTFV